MHISSEVIHFKSSKFKIIEGEDEETNPGCYGVELATWLVNSLESMGYENLNFIAEDWGRCIIVEHEKHLLFVACSAVCDLKSELSELEEYEYIKVNNNNPMEWGVFVTLEYPFFSNWFLPKKIKEENKIKYKKLEVDIINIINSEPEFEKV